MRRLFLPSGGYCLTLFRRQHRPQAPVFRGLRVFEHCDTMHVKPSVLNCTELNWIFFSHDALQYLQL